MNPIKFLGIQTNAATPEKIVATLGGIIAITCIAFFTWQITGYQGTLAILPSMGAATVLLFAVPHGTLSQPWALFAGNLLSAAVGVSCALLIDNIFLAGGFAVGLSIGVMHLARCIHPPGGATALAAVIGGPAVQDLGYWYVLTPTLINCLIILVVAMMFNNCFAWRRYPLSLMRFEAAAFHEGVDEISHDHISQAIHESEFVVDISEEQLKIIFDKADLLRRKQRTRHFQLELGAFYTNGKAGLGWSVRQVVDESPNDNPDLYMVIYRVVEGARKRQTGSCTLEEFSQWAKEKMKPVKQR